MQIDIRDIKTKRDFLAFADQITDEDTRKSFAAALLRSYADDIRSGKDRGGKKALGLVRGYVLRMPFEGQVIDLRTFLVGDQVPYSNEPDKIVECPVCHKPGQGFVLNSNMLVEVWHQVKVHVTGWEILEKCEIVQQADWRIVPPKLSRKEKQMRHQEAMRHIEYLKERRRKRLAGEA